MSEVSSPGGVRADPPPAVQPLSPWQATALHVSGVRMLLDARSAGRAARQTAYSPHEAPGRLPADHGMDEAAPALAGAGILPAAEHPVTGPLQLLRSTRQRTLAAVLFREGHAQRVQMAQSTGRKAAEFYLGAIHPGPRSGKDSTAAYHGGQTTEGVRVRTPLCTADASTTEEPEAGKPHVRDCTGGAG